MSAQICSSEATSDRWALPKKTLLQRAEDVAPILHWLPRYNVARDLKFDVVAGITVAMMLIPQEVSLSTIMHVPAHHALYTAATAPLVYAIFGSSTVLSVASGSEVALLTGTILEKIEDEDERIATGIMLAFLSGCILLLVRLLNLSQIADFFSRPVMGGFISAGGLLIMLSQVQNVLGVSVNHATYPPQTVYRICQKLPDTNTTALAVGLLSIAYLIAVKKCKKRFFSSPVLDELFDDDTPRQNDPALADAKPEEMEQILTPIATAAHTHSHDSHGFSLTDQQYVSMESAYAAQHPPQDELLQSESATVQEKTAPKSKAQLLAIFVARTICDLGPLVVCIGGGIAGYLLGPDALKLTGEVPGGFPEPKVPWYGFTSGLIDGDRFGTIALNAATIAVVVFLSSIAMAKRLAIQRGEDINTEQELTGVGLASVVCGFFQALPSTGGMSRTAVNMQNAHTQLASIITCFIVIVALYTLTSTLYYLPRATLAAIIIVAGYSLVEFREAKWLYRVKRDEFFVWSASFVLTLGLGVLDGLIASIVTCVLALMIKTKRSPVAVLGELPNGSLVDRELFPDAQELDGIVAVRVEGSLYFANCERVVLCIEREMQRLQTLGLSTRGVVLDTFHMNDMDATTIGVLSDMQEKLAVRKVCLAVANAKPRLHDMLAAASLTKRLLAKDPTISTEEAVRLLRELPRRSSTTTPTSRSAGSRAA